MDLVVQDTIYSLDEIIDDYTVNELYEERGNSFDGEY